MACCPQRTVQNIDKYKQKNAELRRYNTVSGRVTSQCCITPCILPTAGAITTSNCVFVQETYITTCDYTVASSGGTSFQWFYISGSNPPQPFVNGTNISGSQTQTLRMGAVESDTCIISSIYCIVTNNCGSVQSSNAAIVGGCPIVQ